MKKVAKIFLIVTFWLGFAGLLICLATGVLGLVFSSALIDKIVEENTASSTLTPEELRQAVSIAVYAVCGCFIAGSVWCVAPMVVCPITKNKLEVAKSRKEMIALGVLNVIFGSVVSAVMIFVMPDRYYQKPDETDSDSNPKQEVVDK